MRSCLMASMRTPRPSTASTADGGTLPSVLNALCNGRPLMYIPTVIVAGMLAPAKQSRSCHQGDRHGAAVRKGAEHGASVGSCWVSAPNSYKLLATPDLRIFLRRVDLHYVSPWCPASEAPALLCLWEPSLRCTTAAHTAEAASAAAWVPAGSGQHAAVGGEDYQQLGSRIQAASGRW